jgi:hypothetical protein
MATITQFYSADPDWVRYNATSEPEGTTPTDPDPDPPPDDPVTPTVESTV